MFTVPITCRFRNFVFVTIQQELEEDASGPPGFGQSTRTYVWCTIDWNVCVVARALVFSGMCTNLLFVRFGRSSRMSNDRSGMCIQFFTEGTIDSRKCLHHTHNATFRKKIQISFKSNEEPSSCVFVTIAYHAWFAVWLTVTVGQLQPHLRGSFIGMSPATLSLTVVLPRTVTLEPNSIEILFAWINR